MAEQLIVSLDEFAELAQVTPETMRGYVRDLDPPPAWMIERGDRGRAYKIDAEPAIAWWQKLRADEALSDQERRDQLAQLRLGLVGADAGDAQQLALSGRQRSEEIEAAMRLLKYRKMLGQLLEKADVERELSAAAVSLRRRLQQLPAEFGVSAGLAANQVRDLEARLDRSVAAFVEELRKAAMPIAAEASADG